MAVNNWELGNEIFASVLVEHEIFFSSCSCKQIHVNLLLVFVGQRDLVIISYAGVGFGLLVLVPFLVVVLFVVDGVVEGEAIHIPVDTSRDNSGVVMRDSDVLNVVRKGKKLNYGNSTLRVS